MNSQDKVKWFILIISLLISYLIVNANDWGFYELLALTLTFHFALLMIYKFGKTLPIRELAAFVYTVQILVGAFLTYDFYPHIPIGGMTIRPERYFEYAIPCILVFIAGLYFPRFRYTGFDLKNLIDYEKINKKEWSKFGLHLIISSFVVQVASGFAPSSGLNFIYTLFFYFRFVGVYYMWIGKYKYRYLFLAVIFVPFVLSSFAGGLFIELFIWVFLTVAALQLSRAWSFRINLTGFLAGLCFVFLLQSVKVDFRKVTWKDENRDMPLIEKVGYLANLATSFDIGNDKTRALANVRFVIRINEGYIVAAIMRNMPYKQPFVDGEYFKNELLGIFVPRFLFPDKAVVGDHEKFEKFAGWKLDKRVAMAVSILGDGYGNFGPWGGIIFCFLNGLLLNFLLHLCTKMAEKHEKSLVLWMPLIFTFSVRCGDEFYIITNHIVKSSILIFFIFLILKKTGRLARLSATAQT